MRRISAWMFDNPARLKMVALGTLLVAVAMFWIVLLSRIPSIPDAPQDTLRSTQAPQPSVTVSEPGATPTTPSYGDSTNVAQEAVRAWFVYDLVGFAKIAQPGVVEEFADTKPVMSGHDITGKPKILQGGVTKQFVRVPTTDGPIDLRMVVSDGRWVVESMAYFK